MSDLPATLAGVSAAVAGVVTVLLVRSAIVPIMRSLCRTLPQWRPDMGLAHEPRDVAVIPPCTHRAAVEVESAGERVAWLCPDCDAQLPAEWMSPYHARPPRGPGGGSRSRTASDCQHVPGTEITRLGSLRHEYLCSLCGAPYKGAWRSRDTAETARWEAEKEDTR